MEKHRTTKDQSSSMITKGSHNRNSMQTLSDLERLREAEAAWLASREQLVLCNTRLISGFVAKNSDRGMDIADLRQTGVVGLIIGADRYDHRMGYKFGTYASWWIRQAIQRGIQLESKSIRLPANQYITLAKMHRFKENYRKENAGMDPTNVEIAQVLGMTLRNLEDLLAISQPTRYLDKPVGETDDTMADSIEDKKALDPFGSAVVQARREAVEDMLKILTGRERKIIELRFGLENGQPHTLNEIAKLYRLTRERVRQLQNKGLAKLSRRFGDRADLAELISDA